MDIAGAIAIAASLAGVGGAVFAALTWIFGLTTRVAVLEQQVSEVQPVAIAKDIAWIKGAVATLAKVLHADLEPE